MLLLVIIKHFKEQSYSKRMVVAVAIILAPHVVQSQEPAVSLISTLQQNSLCPGDGGATFTCTCHGTDLTWVVNGRMLSYNRNAPVGAVRSNAESDETAILLRIQTLRENGFALRVSVLTVGLRQYVTQPITVQCHNGSAGEAITKTFWRKVADPPSEPSLNFGPMVIPNGINISWYLPYGNEALQTINHYIVQVDEDTPLSVENTTVVVYTPQTKPAYNVSIRAVDECGQTGEALRMEAEMMVTTDTFAETTATDDRSTGAKTSHSITTSGETKGAKGFPFFLYFLGIMGQLVLF